MKFSPIRTLMPKTRARLRNALTLCTLLSLQSCINDPEVGDSTIRGTYTLRSVAGVAPPYTKSNVGNTRVELLEDNISLFMGFTMSEEVTLRTTTNGVATTQMTTYTGTYAPGYNNTVVLNQNGGPQRIVTIDNGKTMTYSDVGVVYVWKK